MRVFRCHLIKTRWILKRRMHCLSKYVSSIVNCTVCLFFKRVKKQKFSETAWLTPFLCLVCADKMLLGGFNSISLLNPPPHCSKTQHPELILNVVWTVFLGGVFLVRSNTFFEIDCYFSVCLATVEFRSSMDSGVCTQEPSIKSSMVLTTKKSVTYPGDLQDTPLKPPLYHKQPPALPPKPFSRIPNHSTGQWSQFIQYILFDVLYFTMSDCQKCEFLSVNTKYVFWEMSRDCCCFNSYLRCQTCAQDYSSLIKFPCG